MTAAGRALPEGRYGRQRPARSRRMVATLTACGLVVGVVVAYVGYRNLGTSSVDAERTAFSSQPGNRMKMTITVTRDTPEKAAVCVVRVRGADGQENGRKEVYVPPGGASVQVSTVVRGTTEPVTADVFGCSYQVPAYLSTAQPPTG
ncbi:DUF4307 domain-containing protein [Actinokineospora inagensis]|uniref:DUF4307 domain-containing protein n=1 Tax=Actinokineospora inagensis TaxID=103730 RepID=UPI0004287DEA|nr:DUF4307 domain-containing protein [Actinokineospora inagensis]